jgi:hypothetical protein
MIDEEREMQIFPMTCMIATPFRFSLGVIEDAILWGVSERTERTGEEVGDVQIR